MSGFDTRDGGDKLTSAHLVSRDEAKTKIMEMARDEGIEGAFKVFHKGEMVSNPDSLPDEVDMDDISVSAVLDQAVIYGHWFLDGFGELTTVAELV